MAVFAISFRVGDKGDANQRRSSVIEQIQKEASGATWEETTSFFLIQSGKSADDIASSIYVNSSMDPALDKLLVVNLTIKAHATRGNIEQPKTLAAIMANR